MCVCLAHQEREIERALMFDSCVISHNDVAYVVIVPVIYVKCNVVD